MKEYKENHKSLFVSDEPQEPIPQIVKPGVNPKSPSKGMSLLEMMKLKNSNPDAVINFE